MRVNLVAVQAALQVEHYRTEESFRQRVLALTARAAAGLPEGIPRLIAFPEAFALPLLFWLDTPATVIRRRSAVAAAVALLKVHWRDALRCVVRHRVCSPAVFYHWRGLQVWPVYERVFREAAVTAGGYVVAGSLLSPIVDWEPTRGFHPASRRAYNVGLVVSPKGAVLARVPKLRLTPDERASFLSTPLSAPQVIVTDIGKIAVLICLDAFHEALVEQADAAGAWLLVQPSANNALWNGPWSGDARQREGDAWLRHGLAKKLEGRENLRYGLNPMLNGELYDLHFEGRSSVAAAGEYLAVADEPAGDAIVSAEVEHTASARASAASGS
jgi:predicted amidohydrolase